jgi:hypothetical protein
MIGFHCCSETECGKESRPLNLNLYEWLLNWIICNYHIYDVMMGCSIHKTFILFYLGHEAWTENNEPKNASVTNEKDASVMDGIAWELIIAYLITAADGLWCHYGWAHEDNCDNKRIKNELLKRKVLRLGENNELKNARIIDCVECIYWPALQALDWIRFRI